MELDVDVPAPGLGGGGRGGLDPLRRLRPPRLQHVLRLRPDGGRTACASTPGRSRAGPVSSPRRGPRPDDVRPELVWAALDCPSGWAVDDFQREGVLLGRMAAEIDRLPEPGEPHVVLGWRVGEDGRKRFAGLGPPDGGRRSAGAGPLDVDRFAQEGLTR